MNLTSDQFLTRKQLVPAILAAWLLCGGSSSLWAQAPGQDAPAPSDNVSEMRAKLGKAVDVELVETPLVDAIAYLSDQSDLPILLDVRGLDDIGVSSDHPVSLNVRNLPLKQALKLIGDPIGLSYELRNEVLIFTSKEVTESNMQHEVIPVGEILAGIKNNRELLAFRDTLESSVAPESWAQVGGPGSLSLFGKSLIVSQTEANLEELNLALAAIRKIDTNRHSPIDAAPAPKVLKALSQTASLEFVETPLEDALQQISQIHELPIVLDTKGLEEDGIATDSPVTIRVQNVSLRSALRLALHHTSPELVFEVHPNMLRITTDSAQSLALRIYPIGDLCATEDAAARLQRVITESVTPDSWDSYGGLGVISRLGVRQQSLVIRQYNQTHGQIEALLKKLRAVRKTTGDASSEPPTPEAMVLRGYTIGLQQDTPKEALEQVVEFLKDELAEEWKEDGARVGIVAGQLVVRQRESVHQRVRETLQQLGIFVSAPQKGGGLGNGGFF